MRRFLALIWAGLLGSLLPCAAQLFTVDDLYLETRTSVIGHAGGEERFNVAFAGEFLNFNIQGRIADNLSYRVRHRFNKPVYDPENPLNATDFLWLRWDASPRWGFSIGKLPVMIGGFEFDDAPINVYYWNGFCNHVWQVYCLGAQAFWNPNDHQTFSFQVVDSPWSKGQWGIFSWNLGWMGQFAPWWKTLWSVNLIDDVERRGMQYISLGNRFEAGGWALELDWMDREAIHRRQKPLSDWSLVARLTYDWKNWGVFVKGGYDVNAETNVDADGVPFDVVCPAGMEYIFGGGGIECFPIPDREDLRLHAVVWKDNQSPDINFSLGVSYRIRFLNKKP